MSDDNKGATSKPRRKLTPFLCQEMLYDFALGQLDSERKLAVEDFIKTDSESQRILASIRKGLEYAERLNRLSISADVLAQVRESENAISLGRRYSSWREWPEVFRWSVTAIALSAIVAGFVSIVPWSMIPSFRSKKSSDTIEIAEINRLTDRQLEAAQENPEVDLTGDEGSGDEEIEAAEVPIPVQNRNSKVAARDRFNEVDAAASPTAVASNSQTQAKLLPPTKSAAEEDESASAGASGVGERKEAKPKGFVYRAFMALPNLDELGPKITEAVTELGAEKAGEVELGWKRGSGRYYHFAMPEENEEKLLEKLRAYGPVRLSKDPHPRVMPQGQVRFILWVESR